MKFVYYPELKGAQAIHGWVSLDKVVVNLEVGETVELKDHVARELMNVFRFLKEVAAADSKPKKAKKAPESAKELVAGIAEGVKGYSWLQVRQTAKDLKIPDYRKKDRQTLEKEIEAKLKKGANGKASK